MRTGIVTPSLIQENVAPIIVYRVSECECVMLVMIDDGGQTSMIMSCHTSFEESSRAQKSFITFDTYFWRYLPSRSRIGGSLK